MVNVKFEDALNGHTLASFTLPAGLGHLLIALTRSHRDAAERFDIDTPVALTSEEADKAEADKKKAEDDEAKEHAAVVKQALADRKEAEHAAKHK